MLLHIWQTSWFSVCTGKVLGLRQGHSSNKGLLFCIEFFLKWKLVMYEHTGSSWISSLLTLMRHRKKQFNRKLFTPECSLHSTVKNMQQDTNTERETCFRYSGTRFVYILYESMTIASILLKVFYHICQQNLSIL